jgi:hypothetical protein
MYLGSAAAKHCYCRNPSNVRFAPGCYRRADTHDQNLLACVLAIAPITDNKPSYGAQDENRNSFHLLGGGMIRATNTQ